MTRFCRTHITQRSLEELRERLAELELRERLGVRLLDEKKRIKARLERIDHPIEGLALGSDQGIETRGSP